MITLDEEKEEKSEKKPNMIDDKIDQVLLKARRIFFCDAVDGDTAKDAIRKLWYLELMDPGKPILFVINSPGGAVDSGLAIMDQVHMITSPVTTLVTGLAASMGSVLSLCAGPGKRFATKHSRIMIHQPAIHGVIRGQATDLDIQAKEIIKTKHMFINMYTEATGQSKDVIAKAIDRDTWMSPEEAIDFGLLDEIVSSYAQIGF